MSETERHVGKIKLVGSDKPIIEAAAKEIAKSLEVKVKQ